MITANRITAASRELTYIAPLTWSAQSERTLLTVAKSAKIPKAQKGATPFVSMKGMHIAMRPAIARKTPLTVSTMLLFSSTRPMA